MQSILRVVLKHSCLIGRKPLPIRISQFRPISITSLVEKIHKKGHEDQRKPNVFYESDSEHLKPSVQKMKEMEEIFRKQLEKRLSFRTDLRVFEEFFVEFPDKTRHNLAHIGQISKKGPLITINFSKNPSYASLAKTDLDKHMPEIKIQQEGPYLHIQAQQLTREERRERINRVKASLVNEYKKALNALYSKYVEKFEAIKDKDERDKCCAFVLHNKKALDAAADAMIKQQEEKLLSEVV